MDQLVRGQVNHRAAEIYEDFFLPALFEQWADVVADAAQIQAGDRVLDVACGTGVVARAAAHRIGATGWVGGLDINEGMLAVAARKAPGIEWRHGQAESLPFESGSLDAVTCQFGLMFFEDRARAVREMRRVLRPGGRVAVAVWDGLDHTPGYAAMVTLLQQLFGEDVAEGLRAPFTMGDADALRALFVTAGLPNAQVTTRPGTARFPSIEDWVRTDVYGWVLADVLSEAQVGRLLVEAQQALARFADAEGRVAFAAPAHILWATTES